MKKLLFLILLTLPCVCISQVINPPLTLSPDQVKRVYIGLKERDAYAQRFNDCVKSADSLNNIIQEQDYNLNLLADNLREYNAKIDSLYNERQRAAVEIQKIKSEKTAWYKHPILWGVLGLIGGILIVK